MSDLVDLIDAPPLWQLVLGRGEVGFAAGRNASADHCDKCGGYVLGGLDDDRCALWVMVDAEPVNALGEAVARLTDLWTYELRRAKDGYRLDRRDPGHIRGRPAGTVVDVMVEHRCGRSGSGSGLERAKPVLGRARPVTNPRPTF